MQDFVYYVPTRVVFGRKALDQLEALLSKGGYRHILIHYGGGSVMKSGLLDQIIAHVEHVGAKYTLLGGVSPNPKVALVREGVDICKQETIDFILAVGGGSVIDSAKGIALGAKMDADIWEVFDHQCRPDQALPIGCVLTIAAAGSEMAGGLVISNEENGLKRDYGNECLRPVFCLENPELSYTVSKWQTACGTVDTLMHTFERYFTPTKGVDLSDEMAEGLLRAVIRAGRIAYENPTDYEARATLMWASSLSQNDLTGVGRQADWTTHQLEHDLSGMYDHVSHGAGLAVIFPAWYRYVMNTDIDRFCRFAQKVWGISGDGLSKKEWAEEGIKETERFFGELGMPRSLKELSVNVSTLPEMARKCSFEGKRTLGGFQVLDQADMLNIYRLAYE